MDVVQSTWITLGVQCKKWWATFIFIMFSMDIRHSVLPSYFKKEFYYYDYLSHINEKKYILNIGLFCGRGKKTFQGVFTCILK